VTEIKQAARRDPLLGAEGAVLLLERISPALENVDSSSGAIGTAVNKALDALVPLITEVVADVQLRDGWLDRLWAAIEADQIPYLDRLPDYWGDLCGSKELAAVWADRLNGITRLALSPDPTVRGYYCGTSACLSALYRAERYQEIVELLDHDDIIWPYRRWAVKALGALGRTSEAVQYAESCRGPWTSDYDVDRVCEDILLVSGLVEDAYLYGLRANRAGTYVATFRAVARKHPHKTASEILHDLVRTMPGDEGKWFAAAKEAGLYDEALALASASACDPRTLTRAARELAISQPDFAIGAGLLALYWLVYGQGYEITGADVWAAYTATIGVAQTRGLVNEVRERIRRVVAAEVPGGLVSRSLGRELGL